MNPTDILARDHDFLRSQLQLLEGLMPMERLARFPLREVAFSISRRVRCHSAKEEAVFDAVRERDGMGSRSPLIEELVEEHQDQKFTAALLVNLLNGDEYAVGSISTCCGHLVEGLRRHMRTEEIILFPQIEELFADRLERAILLRRLGLIARSHYPEGEPLPNGASRDPASADLFR